MNKVVLLDIDYTLFDTDLFKESDLTTHSLYEEVVEVLGKISQHATLGIFSEGNTEFQRDKLIKTDIMKHFDEKDIHIFSEKIISISQVLDKYEDSQIFLVDDRPTILREAKKQDASVFTIYIDRIDRKMPREDFAGFTPDATVLALDEILPIVVSS